MDLTLSSEQEEFAQACRTLVERHWSRQRDGTHSDELWQALAAAGWLGVPFAERYGGSGATLFELGIAYREAGRALLPTTFASTMFAALLIERLGREEQAMEWLPRIAGGAAVGTVAFAEPHAHYRVDAIATVAREDGDGWRLSGEKSFVPNAARADLMLVAALVEGAAADAALTLFIVAPDAPGIDIADHRTFAGDPQHRIRLRDVRLPADALLGERPGCRRGYEDVLDAVTALQCMEILGGAEQVLEFACEHVTRREQFGRPIGTFQAVQHRIADLSTQVRAGRLAAFRALWLVSAGRPAAREVSIAKAWLSRAFVDTTVWAHHLHGGIGYVRETGLYRWSERAKLAEVQYGDVEFHLARVARSMLD